MRCLYVDLDGTLLGPDASLLTGADGRFSLLGVARARGLRAGRRRGRHLLGPQPVERVRGRPADRLVGLHLRARLRAGDRRRARVADRRPGPSAEAGSIYDQIEAPGAPALLLERFAGQLEYHTPWSIRTRGLAPVSRRRRPRRGARCCLTSAGFGWLRSVDNGVIRAASEQMPGLPVIHAYHLIPAGASKARAVARAHAGAWLCARGLHRGRRLPRGHGGRRPWSARSGWWPTRSSAISRWRPRRRGAPEFGSPSESYGAGVYEAVVTTLAEGR